MNTSSPPIFSRILLIIGGLAVIGLAYWFIRTSLMPVSVSPVPLANRGAVKFDPALDVSKNEAFFRLHSLLPSEPVAVTPGRINPFVPVPVPVRATSTTSTPPITPPTLPEIEQPIESVIMGTTNTEVLINPM
ncbi:MAG: hypothetical protein ABIB04_01830 [Patescibacteria group bacterium]